MNENSPSISTASAAMPPLPDSGGGRPSRRKWWLVAALAVAAVAVGAPLIVYAFNVGSLLRTGPGELDASDLPAAMVERGSMTATITESGELVAEKSQMVRNDLRWSGEIEKVAEEGTHVKAGEVLIQFKCDQLTDAIEEGQLSVRQADDAHKAAVAGDELMKMQMDTNVRKAHLGVEDAKNDLKRYLKADWPQKRNDAQDDIKLAERDLKLAEHKLQSKLKINADPELNTPYSQNEIDAERLSVDRLKLARDRAKTQAEILVEYTHPRTLRDLGNAVADADLALLAANAEHEKQLKLSRSGVDLAAHRFKQEKEKFDRLIEDRDERMVVTAKEPGLVVFETRRRRWHRPITVAVGEKVQPGQQLMIIPDISTLVFKTQVYEAVQETVRDKVSHGLNTVIRLDARRTQVFTGRVTKVASLPDSQNPWLSPGVKVYPTTIVFDKEVTSLNLKPGMTGDVEITLEELTDVLSVPIAAVFADQDTTFCYGVDSSGRARRAIVKIGLTSSARVQILDGLAEGDRVLLVPPPGAKLHARKKDKKKEDDGPRPPAGMNNNAGGRGAKQPTSRPARRERPSGGRRGGSRGGGGRRGG